MSESNMEMKNRFVGSGVLIGFALAFVPIVVITAITGRVVLGIPVGVVFGISLGMHFERRLQGGKIEIKPRARGIAMALVGILVIILSIGYLLAHSPLANF
jgi:polyferredoxin